MPHNVKGTNSAIFDNLLDSGGACLRSEGRGVDLAVVCAIGVNETELVRNEAHVAIATIPLALHRNIERAAHGHERDIERRENLDGRSEPVRARG
jgi:hypothetical protein